MRFLMILSVLMMLIVPSTHAQETESWYFAATRTDLMAFTLDGEQNILLEGSLSDFDGFTRLSPQTALLWWKVEEGYQPFLLTPTEAIPLSEQPFRHVARPIAANDSYQVLVGSPFAAEEILLLDENARRLTPLTGIYDDTQSRQAVRFSETTLRYVTFNGIDPNTRVGTLWERDLASGTEIALTTTAPDLIQVQSTPDGSTWWFLYSRDVDGERRIEFVGFGEGIETATALLNAQQAFLWDDRLVVVDYQCTQDCPLEIQSLRGGPTLNYTLPTQDITFRHLYADGGLLAEDADRVLRVYQTEGTILEVGEWNAQRQDGFQSEDWRWVVTTTDTHFQLWDMEQGKMVMEQAFEMLVAPRFAGDSVLITDATGGGFFYDGSQQFTLPPLQGQYRLMFDGVLVAVIGVEAERGIYSVDVASGERTLVVANAVPFR